MSFAIYDFSQTQIFIDDGFNEWFIPKFRLKASYDEPNLILEWTDTEIQKLQGIHNYKAMDYTAILFDGTDAPTSAEDAFDTIDEYIVSSLGGGDVDGPASAVDDNIAVFDGVTGKLIKDGGMTIAQIIAASGGYTIINVNTTPYTVIPTTGQTIYNVDTSGGAITMDFPTAIGNTAAYTVNNRGANSVIIDPFGAQTINGNPTRTLLFLNTSVDIYSDGANLFIR